MHIHDVKPTPPPWLFPRAAYVHIPFCRHHCRYCDFAVVEGQDHAVELYLEALGAEMAHLGRPHAVDTLFVGGGTPTHLEPAALGRLLRLLGQWLPVQAGGEYTFEANPTGLSADKIALLAGHGVNRLSLGAQSFHPETLQFLERDHTAEEIRRVVHDARQRMQVVSLDLIFGVPGQSPTHWADDLRQALDLGIDHVSTYGLTYEKGTRLWKDQQRGGVVAQDEDAELELYLLAIDLLEGVGWEHYEISSFAPTGKRCRHNQVYWANHAYHGFGLGAARYVGGRREVNTRELQRYLRLALAGESATQQGEELDPLERAHETLSLNLRRAEGIDRAQFQLQTGFAVDAIARAAIERGTRQNLLRDDGQRIALTRAGKCVADAVMGWFLV